MCKATVSKALSWLKLVGLLLRWSNHQWALSCYHKGEGEHSIVRVISDGLGILLQLHLLMTLKLRHVSSTCWAGPSVPYRLLMLCSLVNLSCGHQELADEKLQIAKPCKVEKDRRSVRKRSACNILFPEGTVTYRAYWRVYIWNVPSGFVCHLAAILLHPCQNPHASHAHHGLTCPRTSSLVSPVILVSNTSPKICITNHAFTFRYLLISAYF
jgi:hypothetical protein